MGKHDPLELERHRQRVAKLMGKGDTPGALQLLGKLYRGGIADARMICEYARILHSQADFAASAACLARLVRDYPEAHAIHGFAAGLFYTMRRPGEALAIYQKFPPHQDRNGTLRLAAAEILERQGRLAEARETVAAVLREHPSSALARFQLAVLDGRSGADEAAIAALHDLRRGDNPEIRWKAGHLLASQLDKQGDYSAAAAALLAAKAGMEADFADEITRARKLWNTKATAVRTYAAALTRDHLLRWRGESHPPLRLGAIVGHPRSGTTLLESILDAHAGIATVEETVCLENSIFRAVFDGEAKAELFNPEFLDAIVPPVVFRARRTYQVAMEQFLPTPLGDRLLIDKNPMLTHFLGAAMRFVPDMKLIVALRDPRDICLSCFQQPVGIKHSNVSWLRLDDTMRAYNDIMAVWLKFRDILPDGFLEIRYEHLIEKPEFIAQEVTAFLGLSRQPEMLQQRATGQERTIYSPTYAQVAAPVYRSSVGRWEKYAQVMEPHLPILAPVIAELGYA